MGNINFQVEVPIGPRWQSIELLRTSILNCLAAIFHDEEISHQVSVVASELLENAVKYGDWTQPQTPDFQLRVWGDKGEVNVEVCNPTDKENGNIEKLFEMVQWLKSFDSPVDAYSARLRELADNENDIGSRLGLARILYEGNCQLHCSEDNGKVRVRAVVPGAPA